METYDSFGTTVVTNAPDRVEVATRESQSDSRTDSRALSSVDNKVDTRTSLSLEATSAYTDMKVQERINPSAKMYRNSWVHDLLDQGIYKVEKGDSLALVARRALGVSGHADASTREIAAEVRRIAALNDIKLDAKGRPVQAIHPDMVLNIGRKSEAFSAAGKVVESAPGGKSTDDAPRRAAVNKDNCAEDRPRVQHNQGVLKAGMCDRMEVSENAFVTVRPGADVIVRNGARAFVFGGSVSAEANSRIFAAGGEITARPGASVKFIGNDAKVMQVADIVDKPVVQDSKPVTDYL
jgi:LysM repeat protein